MGSRIDRIVKGSLKGNLGIYRTPGPRELAPQRMQQRIVEQEDAALARVAEAENSAPADEAQSTALAVAEVEDSLDATFNPEAPYMEVRGEPGCAFVQGKFYFGRDRAPVRQAPEHVWYFPAPVEKKSHKEAARAEVARLPKFTDVPRAPRAIVNAEKENAQAAAAEALAE